jgi:NADH-quinone oxidoreductase subunit G
MSLRLINTTAARNGVRADTGQSRGAQSGEADRNAVWLVRQNLEPRLGPFDPQLVLHEIRQVVPGYSSMHVEVGEGRPGVLPNSTEPDLIRPSQDDLFASGTLGRYSRILDDVLEKRITLPYESTEISGDRST